MGIKGRRPQPQNADQVALYISVAEDLKEAAREAREVLKDLMAERKRAEDVLGRVSAITDEAIVDNVRTELAKLEEVTVKAMDDSVARVIAKFEELESTLMGESRRQRRQGSPSLHDLIRTLTGLPEGVPFEVTVENQIVSPDDKNR